MFQDYSITVLHIDDNETNRYIIAHMLREAGYYTVEATTGEKGLQLIAQQKPDLVILDVQLPGLDGFEVCKCLKSNSETASIPILHLSANFIESQDRARGLNSGADAYLIQPVEPVELIATIKALLRMRQAEASALTLAKEWQTTFNAIHDGVGLLDHEGRFIRCNHSLIELLQKTSDELVGHLHQDFIQPMLDETKVIPFYRAQETRQRENLEIYWEGRWYLLVIDPIYHNHFFTGAVLIISDITERKQAELQLQEQAREMNQLNVSLIDSTSELAQRNQELDRFVYVVSHDLKAPLRSISNLTLWMEEDLAGQLPKENQEQMVLLRQRVHRLDLFIDELLKYSRIGRTEVAAESVDVGQLLDEIIDSLVVPDTFVIEVLHPMPKLVTKRLLLQQVFANLLSNAIKHHDRPDGRIAISVTQQGNYYEFAVTDDGPGIPPEEHERVFEIFQTLTSSDKQENTGIGLSIVKKIIETEGNKIVIDSQLNQGATFRFTWEQSQKDQYNI